MPGPVEVQAATLEKFVESWRRWVADDFLATWSDDLTFTTLPFSYGKPTRSRPQLEPRYRLLMSTLKNLELTVHNIVHDAANGKAAIYALVKADTDFGPYENEQAVFIAFDESGEKVSKIEEMNDTAFRQAWDPKYYEHIGWRQPPKQ